MAPKLAHFSATSLPKKNKGSVFTCNRSSCSSSSWVLAISRFCKDWTFWMSSYLLGSLPCGGKVFYKLTAWPFPLWLITFTVPGMEFIFSFKRSCHWKGEIQNLVAFAKLIHIDNIKRSASPQVASIGEYLWASAVPPGRCSLSSLSAAPSAGGTALACTQPLVFHTVLTHNIIQTNNTLKFSLYSK